MHHYHLLLVEFASVAPPVAVVDLRARNNRYLRLLHRHHHSSSHHSLDATAEGLLLQHHECRLRNHIVDNPTPTADTTANATSNASSNAPSNAYQNYAAASRSYRDFFQLRSWCLPNLGACQAELVLPASPSLWSGYHASSASRPLQLRRWLRELVGGLVGWQEGVVLPCSWQGLPRTGQWMRTNWNHKRTLRLQRWFCQLDGRLERSEEGLVLQECRQGLPSSSGWMRMSIGVARSFF